MVSKGQGESFLYTRTFNIQFTVRIPLAEPI